LILIIFIDTEYNIKSPFSFLFVLVCYPNTMVTPRLPISFSLYPGAWHTMNHVIGSPGQNHQATRSALKGFSIHIKSCMALIKSY